MRIFQSSNYNFIRWRWHALILSLVVIAAGLVTIIARGGLPLGVDFTGGTVVTLEFKQPVSAEQIRSALGSLGADAVEHVGSAGGPIVLHVDGHVVSSLLPRSALSRTRW